MRKLFSVVLVLALFAGIASAQVQGFDYTSAKYQYFNAGAATAVSDTPAVICGVLIDNWLGMGASNYIMLCDSTSATGITTAATTNKICSISMSSVTVTSAAIYGDAGSPTREVWFQTPIDCTYGIVALSNVNVGVKFTVIYKKKVTNRYYGPY